MDHGPKTTSSHFVVEGIQCLSPSFCKDASLKMTNFRALPLQFSCYVFWNLLCFLNVTGFIWIIPWLLQGTFPPAILRWLVWLKQIPNYILLILQELNLLLNSLGLLLVSAYFWRKMRWTNCIYIPGSLALNFSVEALL